MSEFRKVITKPGEVLAYETVFEENPYLRTGVPEKMGSVERLDYDTSAESRYGRMAAGRRSDTGLCGAQ